MIRIIFFLFFLIVALPSFAAKKYASPTGSAANSGNSISQAWSLSFAIGPTSPLNPGDSLLLADGIYPGNYTSDVSGSEGNPIWIMPVNMGKAIIDVGINRTAESGLLINGDYTWFVGLHITSSNTIRKSDPGNGNATVLYEAGITVYGDFTKLINCWIYDVVGGGLQLWRSGLGLEVYGCVIFNNGSQDDLRGTGHGMYIQHNRPDFPKVIRNNIVFQNASQGINIYTTDPVNKGIIVEKNVSFNTGAIADFNPFFFRPPHNLTIGSQNNSSSEMEVTGNVFYSDLQGGRLILSQISNVTIGRTYSPNFDLKFSENIVYGGRNQVEFLSTVRLGFSHNLLFNDGGKFTELLGTNKTYPDHFWNANTYINLSGTATPFAGLSFSEWKNSYGFDDESHEYPVAQEPVEILLVQNEYDQNLYYVTILNLSDQEIINVDFSDYGIEDGREYLIRDIQNPFDEEQRVVGATDGNVISFPMNWTKSLQPKGNMPHQVKHTDKTFGTFVVEFSKLAEASHPAVKDTVIIYLDKDGKVTLKPEQVFVQWPISSEFTATLSKSTFTCEELGENKAIVKISDPKGVVAEKEIEVIVRDKSAPILVTKNVEVTIDLSIGKVALNAEDFISSLTDNCGIKEVKLNRESVGCEEVGKEIAVELRAVDASGNVTEETAKVIVKSMNTNPVTISGSSSLCSGEKQTLKLESEAAFEVVRWRKNGTEISGATGKTLEIEGPGSYYAVVRYSGGCLYETDKFEVKEATVSSPVVISGSESICSGEKQTLKLESEATFEVVRWRKNGTEISGATGKTLEIEGPGSYYAVVRYAGGCLYETDKFEVKEATVSNPVIISGSESICSGEKQTLKLESEAAFEVVRWRKNGAEISGATGKTLEIEGPGSYYAVVRYAGGCLYETDKFEVKEATVSSPVTISGSGSICCGEKQTLKLESETAFEVVRWRRNGTEISGATGNTLEIEGPGSYYAVVRYAGGCLYETDKFEVKEATVSNPVTISGSESICSGEKRTLKLESEAAFEVVRWRKNGSEISGATGKTLEIEGPGSYYAVVRYAGGCLYETDKFEVVTAPTPTGEIVVDGTVLSAPAGDFTYQWFRNGEKIENATELNYTVAQMGEFSVELTNGAGCTARLEAVTMTISGIFNPSILISEELKIYPNPASTQVKIEALGDLEFAGGSMRIYDQNGKEVSSSVEVVYQSTNEVVLAISRLAAGTYVIVLESTDSRMVVGKLVKR